MKNDFTDNAEDLGGFEAFQEIINDMKLSIINGDHDGDSGALFATIEALEMAIRQQDLLLFKMGITEQDALRLIESEERRQNFRVVK